MSVFGRLRALSWTGRLLIMEAFFYLAAARAALAALPFRRLASFLAWQPDESQAQALDALVPPEARQVANAVALTARRTPWDSACLAQAIAAKLMLRRRGLSSLLCLGTRIDETGKLVAHAWLRYGDEILLGGADHKSFTLLSTIGKSPP